MNENFKKAFHVLEFHKILDMLKKYTFCEETKENIYSITPFFSLKEVEVALFETDEAFVILKKFNHPAFLDVKNPEMAFKIAKSKANMSIKMIYNIGRILKQAHSLKGFYNEFEADFNHLKHYFLSFNLNKELENLIFNVLESENEISSSASAELKRIRSKINLKELKIKNILYGFLNGSKKKFLQDNIITKRQGRDVLAIKAEHKNEIEGFVHDISSSGSTIFLEPASVVYIKNEIKALHKEEEKEIFKILKNLTEKCLEFKDEILTNYNVILNLDLIFAKAKLANQMDATKPLVKENGEISLKGARHPLINPNEVVAVDVELGGKFKNLIISGPNTGGKTVVLKTIGLLTIMAMCGILIPAKEGSKISIFNEILVVIGDEQSIKDSLSTFSAHMKKIALILSIANFNSLVLIDEIAFGTDPEQGAALGIAIVEKLCEKKVTLAVTTHYTQLKTFAFKSEFVKNACFEFNLSSLKPTYKLLIGVAGQSNAFQISTKLGISFELIKRAKHFMTQQGIYLDNMIKNLEKNRKEYNRKLKLQEENLLELNSLKEQVLKEKENLNKTVKFKIEKAKKEANLIIKNTRETANSILNELKEIKNKINIESAKELTKKTKSLLKNSIYGLYDKINDSKQQNLQENKIKDLEKGDIVFVSSFEKKATVLEKIDKNQKVLVLMGLIKMRVSVNQLQFLQKAEKKQKNVIVSRKLISRKNRKVKTQVDLRGLDSQEALVVLDKFIDECVLNNLEVVRIIHGKGTGVLRAAVVKHLKLHKNILSQRLGRFGEGEDGVTICELK